LNNARSLGSLCLDALCGAMIDDKPSSPTYNVVI
jgi:hypothetical protein